MLTLAPIENTPYVGGTANGLHWSNASGLQKTSADLTWDATTGLYIGKDVGIGTSTPAAKLHINGGTGSLSTGLAFGDGDSGFYEGADDDLYLRLGGLAKWHWSGGRMIGGNAGVALADVGVSSTTPVLEGPNDANTGYGFGAADALSLITGGVERVRVDSAGNVGIGTANPGSKLDVFGTNTLTDSYGNLFVHTSDAQAIDLGGQITLGGSFTDGGMQTRFACIAGRKETGVSTAAGGYMVLGTSISAGGTVTEKMRITSAGRVGIGTSNPGYKFDVQGTTGNIGARVRTTVGHANVYVDCEAGKEAGVIFLDGSTTKWAMYKTGSNTLDAYNYATSHTPFRIQADDDVILVGDGGYVGIGTASPEMNLDVSGSLGMRVYYSTAGGTIYLGRASSDQYASFAFSTSGENSLIIKTHYSGGTNNIITFAPGATERMRITQSGCLGVGVTSPYYVLDVTGGIDGSVKFQNVNTDSVWKHNRLLVGHYLNSEEPFGAFSMSSNGFDNAARIGGGWSSYNAATVIQFYTAANDATVSGTEQMRITSDGKVGIGITTPTTRLHLAGNTTSHYAQIDTAIKFNEVTAPGALTPTLLVLAGNVDVGDHRYAVTFVTPIGETALGTTSATITCAAGSQQVDLTNIPVSADYRVTARKVYRTIASSPLYHFKLLTTINDNVTTTYTDNTADASLTGGSIYPGYWYMENSTCRYATVGSVAGMYLGSTSTYLGRSAGTSVVPPGKGNTLIGALAGDSITTAGNNTAIGTNALSALVTDGDNVGIGYYAASQLVGTNNVMIGMMVGYTKTTGTQNVYVGYYAGYSSTGGSNNICLGARAGYGANGNQNILIGLNTGYYETGSNRLLISNNTYGSEAADRAWALLYGVFHDAAVSSQSLTINAGAVYLPYDNEKLYFGGGNDASIYYDGTDLYINPKDVGTGKVDIIGTVQADKVEVDDTSTYIDKDGSGNMTFTDAVTGTLTLAECSCPPKVEASETSVAEGNNDVALGASKVLIKWIKITTSSTSWTLTIYTKDDYATKPMEIVTARSGNYDLYFDYPYEDEDATSEFHYNFTSTSGSETHNITVLGYKLR